ncbi:MAG TPA: hypothetical protein VK982_05620 [Bacteroidales bacterium]|nr:hypothetical protein [Bacteroidales bacterium]
MIRNIIYIAVAFLFISCNDSKGQEEINSHALICNKFITSNDEISSDWLNNEHISYNSDLDAYYIFCDKKGVLSISGQLLFIDEAMFKVGADSTVKSIRGFWAGSYNDMNDFLYGLEAELGKPESINPNRWIVGNTSLLVGVQRINDITIKYASISKIKE